MATDSTLPPSQSELMNYAVRMVTPMRREFGLLLDVTVLLRDASYARRVLDQAKTSQDARLREYADYLESKIFGPRNGPATPDEAAAAAARIEPTKAAASPPPDSEAEMRQRMMSKYKRGLR